MVVVPGAIPFTIPELSIVATPGMVEDQIPPKVSLINNVLVLIQILVEPVISATTGDALIVIGLIIVVVQPLAKLVTE